MAKHISPIALGTWSWGTGAAGGDQVFGNQLTEADLKPVFDAAMAAGLNVWDTATVYGMGASEEILGRLASDYPREDLVLSTKFTPQISPDVPDPVDEMCEASLKRLGTDYIDIYWIHNPADVERFTPGLVGLVKSGKVRRVGVSNHNLEQIKRAEEILSAQGVHLSAVQNHFSLLYRSSEDAGILEWCREHGVEFFAYMVLEQGTLSGKYSTANPLPAGSQRGETYNPLMPRIDQVVASMRPIAEAHGVHVAQIPLAWAISKGTTPIIGVTKLAQVADAAAAAQVKLTDGEMAAIEEAAQEAHVDTRGSWENPMA
ncbi:aldo/keto reductase [Bifidobacterium cuniculi]|uniref:Putative aldo/keto reductase n=1 Tax=Bifidobacterium cuniculi TaxID=1688 RepID=A0A087APP0_9BIFI|nr:aldo/keto reductase [Bifidobacterium cuniculi]KFI60740.1 putative aldo/keto reductase [Bifidobacterium cuniculi]